jgi:glycosyltransferase involved in cell wall biosynthesis
MSSQFVFVMEQGLGHVVHAMNLEKVLRNEPGIKGNVIRIRPAETPGVRPLPVIKNWSVQASWAARCSLRNGLKNQRTDAIFIHTQVAALMARGFMRRIPTVVSLDATPLNFDTMAEAYGHERQASALESLKLGLNRRALAGAAAIVTWSHWAARSVVDDYEVASERVHPVYPGVDVRKFRPRATVRRSGPLRVLFVGGDFQRKGGPELVEAVASLQGRVEADIVTSAPAPGAARGGRIRFHTDLGPNSDKLLELYSRSDVFSLPSRGDCTPLAVAEAMACGLPIVASKVGSIPDMVDHGRNGFLVDTRSPRDLAAALGELAADPLLCQSMGAASRLVAEREHDAEKNWRKIFDLMKTVGAAKRYRPAGDYDSRAVSGSVPDRERRSAISAI